MNPSPPPRSLLLRLGVLLFAVVLFVGYLLFVQMQGPGKWDQSRTTTKSATVLPDFQNGPNQGPVQILVTPNPGEDFGRVTSKSGIVFDPPRLPTPTPAEARPNP